MGLRFIGFLVFSFFRFRGLEGAVRFLPLFLGELFGCRMLFQFPEAKSRFTACRLYG